MANNLKPQIKENMKTSPILSIGTYGVHVTKNPAGTYSFVGEVPNTCAGCYATKDEAIQAFVDFYKAQPVDFQRDNIGNLRNDIFALVIEA